MTLVSPRTGLLRAGALAGALLGASALAPIAAQAATGRIQIDVGGQKRTAVIVERERLKRTLRTTLIVLHGSSRANVRGNPADGRRVQRNLGLDEQALGTGALLVYPDAVEGRWNFEPGNQKPDDVAFIRSLAAKLVNDGVADRRRVFVVGVSTGGMMALRIGCEGADFLSGVAVLISGMTAKQATACTPSRPISFMLMNGTANPIVPYQGGKANIPEVKDDVVSADATIAPFAQAAGCGTQRTPHPLADKDPKDGSRVVVERFNGCKTEVEMVRIEGGGHTLPGRPSRNDRGIAVGAQNNDADTPRLVWDFVRRAPR